MSREVKVIGDKGKSITITGKAEQDQFAHQSVKPASHHLQLVAYVCRLMA